MLLRSRRFFAVAVPASLNLLSLLTARPATAQVTLLSNLEAVPLSATTISDTQQKAVAFTTGSTAYSFTSVQATLALASPVAGSSVVAFDLYTPSTPGGSDPGTLLINLGTQNVTNLNNTPTVYTFTPSSAFILNPNTRYVLLASYVSGDSGTWFGSNPATTPTARNGSGYSNVIYRVSTPGMPASNSTVFNLFAINGSSVAAVNGPEPGTLALLVLGAGVLVIRRRKA